ncbi:MAG: YceI family protein [Chitinophagaceae bacterium]
MKRLIFLAVFIIAFCAFAQVDLKPVDDKDAVTFVIKNFGINTPGSFTGLKGSIKWNAENPSNSSFNVSVDANTINTSIDARDNDLRKEKYFDVAKYPTINFVSANISAASVTGNLTIKGITKSVTFPFTVTKQGNGYLFEGSFTINRRDFDVGGSSMVLADNVTVKLKVQANP